MGLMGLYFKCDFTLFILGFVVFVIGAVIDANYYYHHPLKCLMNWGLIMILTAACLALLGLVGVLWFCG